MNKTAITDGLCQALDADTVDKMFFTTAKRAEKAIDAYCLNCPAMVECSKIPATIDAPFGVFGGEWYS